MDYGTSITMTSASAGIAIAAPSLGLKMVLLVILIVGVAALMIRRNFRHGLIAIEAAPTALQVDGEDS